MVDERRLSAIKRLWTDTCCVYVREKAAPVGGLTVFEERLLYGDIPCKLSFKTLSLKMLATAGDGDIAPVSQAVKLFLEKEYVVPPGSRIEVMRDGQVFSYRRSGEPGVFALHQEIPLELDKERA